MLQKRLSVVLALGAALAATCAAAAAYHGHHLTRYATVNLAHARAIALKTEPGAIADEELEREPGGSGLRHSFDIKAGGRTREAGVDARSGAVLEDCVEGSHPD